MRQQARVERRHAHHRRGAAPHQLQHQVRVELRQEEHRAARQQQRVHGHEQSMRMVDRQRVDQHVLVGEAPVIDERQRVRGEIAVRQHRALRAAGGARRVEDRREVIFAPVNICEVRAHRARGLDQRAVFLHAQRLDMGDARARRHGCELFAAGGIAHENLRLGVAEKILDLRGRVGGVERQEDRARAQACEIQQHRVGRFLDLHGDAVAGLHAARAQKIGDAPRARMKIAVGDLAAFRRLDEDFLRRGRAARDQVIEISGHVSPLLSEPNVVHFARRSGFCPVGRSEPPLCSGLQ